MRVSSLGGAGSPLCQPAVSDFKINATNYPDQQCQEQEELLIISRDALVVNYLAMEKVGGNPLTREVGSHAGINVKMTMSFAKSWKSNRRLDLITKPHLFRRIIHDTMTLILISILEFRSSVFRNAKTD